MLPELITSLSGLAVTALAAYLLGAVPFGLVMARLFGLGDIRQIGSGNIGATNVLRTGNKVAALLTLLLDSGKGAIAVILAGWIFADDAAQLAGVAAFLGHCCPIYLGFKGGKGVATFLGTLLALSFFVGAASCLTWLVVAALFRFSSLAALLTALAAPIWAVLLSAPHMTLTLVFLGAVLWARHHSNITRLLRGTEPKIGRKNA